MTWTSFEPRFASGRIPGIVTRNTRFFDASSSMVVAEFILHAGKWYPVIIIKTVHKAGFTKSVESPGS